MRGQYLKYRYTFIVDSLEGDLIGSIEEGNTDLYVTKPENVSMTTQKGNHGNQGNRNFFAAGDISSTCMHLLTSYFPVISVAFWHRVDF